MVRQVSDQSQRRIWGQAGFRLFLSHKAEVMREVGELKDRFVRFGISGFVAHRDINPRREWQDEIENALATMDGFVAILTEGFHDSEWTDQEVGYAVARGVPVLAVRLGADPYGFIGKFQALRCDWDNVALEITKLLINEDGMLGAYITALRECISFDDGNKLAEVLPSIERLTNEQIADIVETYNENNQLQGSHGFNGNRPNYYGPGVVFYLNALGDREYKFSEYKERVVLADD